MVFLKDWSETRKKGRVHFVLYRSVIYAIVWTIVFSITRLLQNGYISIIIYLIVGLLFGILLAEGQWVMAEKKYDKLRNKSGEKTAYRDRE